MSVQDDRRERELCRLFNLDWDSKHQRDGTDAVFTVELNGERYAIDVEVKSTTGNTVSTARDVSMNHIRKWRSHFWIIGFYTKSRDPDLLRTLCLTPTDIEPWVATIEEKILPDFAIANHAADRLTLDDLRAICGDKPFYTIGDAKRLHKSQLSVEQYNSEADIIVDGAKVFSPEAMLRVLRLRSIYISERGATLNNPHVTTTFLRGFKGTSREVSQEWAASLRSIAKDYLLSHAVHPFKKL